MFSLLTRPNQADTTVRNHVPTKAERDLTLRLERIRYYYFSKANASLMPRVRRQVTYRKLVELPEVTPAIAQIIMKQWDSHYSKR